MVVPEGLLLIGACQSAPEATHGPLPRDDRNFSVFTVLDQESGQLSVGDAITIVECIGDTGASSIYEYNVNKSEKTYMFNEDRFWDCK